MVTHSPGLFRAVYLFKTTDSSNIFSNSKEPPVNSTHFITPSSNIRY